MKITFLAHSGFLVESAAAALLFDWWKEELPAIPPELPLYVFASHQHHDHFKPEIFALPQATEHANRDIRYILGCDIRLTPRNLERWNISPETAARCQTMKGGQSLELPQAKVEAFPSTDEGVAFLVTLPDGTTLFHAGDLNWWHWEGESKAWNHNMAANFKRFTEPLRGRRLDIAMLPLDPRLSADGFRGPAYFFGLAEIGRFLPMHQWGEFGFTEKFLESYPNFRERTVMLEHEVQTWGLCPHTPGRGGGPPCTPPVSI